MFFLEFDRKFEPIELEGSNYWEISTQRYPWKLA
jgi:hypothetical protein